MNLTATVIEIIQNDGYATVRYQLAGVDGASCGDVISVSVSDATGYEVGQVKSFSL